MTSNESFNRSDLQPEERLIVALDVPTPSEALDIVRSLEGLVSFYKVGLELLMSGAVDALLRELAANHRIFVDLKLPNDIPETVRRAVKVASNRGVAFLTLSSSATRVTIEAALAGRGTSGLPELLFVPVLSSVGEKDFEQQTGQAASAFQTDLVARATVAKNAGVDGFIVSGQEIRLLRATFPHATLVSPGIRPSGAASDDHKRSCTPRQAIQWGADYIVVGRPIRDASRRRDAAERIVAEIAEAMGCGGLAGS